MVNAESSTEVGAAERGARGGIGRWTVSARSQQAAVMGRRMRALWADPAWRQWAIPRYRLRNAARRLPFDVRFARHLVWTPTGCAIWRGSRSNPGGYGRVNVRGRIEYAHRIAYLATGATIPRGWYVTHTCKVNACCAPAHLRAVAPGDHSWARTVEEIFDLLTEPEPNSNCLLWVGSRHPAGYGQITTPEYKGSAHRFVFLALGGTVGPGEDLHHVCHVRVCVAPWHLVPMAESEHMRLSAQEYWARRGVAIKPAAAAPDPLADLVCLCGQSRGIFAGECCETAA